MKKLERQTTAKVELLKNTGNIKWYVNILNIMSLTI